MWWRNLVLQSETAHQGMPLILQPEQDCKTKSKFIHFDFLNIKKQKGVEKRDGGKGYNQQKGVEKGDKGKGITNRKEWRNGGGGG